MGPARIPSLNPGSRQHIHAADRPIRSKCLEIYHDTRRDRVLALDDGYEIDLVVHMVPCIKSGWLQCASGRVDPVRRKTLWCI